MQNDPATASRAPQPWQVAAVTVILSPVLGLVATYFMAKWAEEAGLRTRQFWQVWAISTVVWLTFILPHLK